MERRFITTTISAGSIRVDDGEEKNILSGYAAVFYRDAEGFQFDWGFDLVERIMPGAFDKAIQGTDGRGDVVATFNHNSDNVLGRSTAKTLRLKVDDHGLHYSIDVPDTQIARDVVTHVKRGDIRGSSFMFDVTGENWRMEDGIDIREVTDVALWDVGPVTYPAFEATSVQARSLIVNSRELWQARQTKPAIQRYKARARWVTIDCRGGERSPA